MKATVIVAVLAVSAMATTGCSSNSTSSPGSAQNGGGSGTSNGNGSGDGTGGSSGTSSASGSPGDSSGSAGSGSAGSGSGSAAPEPVDAAPAAQSDAGVVLAADGGTVEDINPTTSDFDCLKNSEWTTVGLSRYKNLLGHEAETLSIARSPNGGVFPVGTVVQLVPGEAMVKRGKGYSPASDDWEFFALNPTSTGTTISMSGGNTSVTNLVGSCLGCHGAAKPQWDLVCGDVDGGNTHGCAPLPIPGSVLAASSDPRCP
jgi:hypothetical protein